MSKQSLAEILADQLDQIDELGGPERHQLAQVIGRDAYDALISKARGSDLVDRWIDATGKAKPAATKALSIAIARVADRADLTKRIEREIKDTFAEPPEKDRGRSFSSGQAKTVGRRPVQKSKPKIDLAALAKANDLSGYMKARQKGE